MLPLIALAAFVLSAAYMNVKWIAQTEKSRNRNAIWFFIALCDIGGTILAVKIYNVLRNGIDLKFAGFANYFLLILGGSALFLISSSLLSLLARHGAQRQGMALVFLLDLIMSIVIFGLFLL